MKTKHLFSILTVVIAASATISAFYLDPPLRWWIAGGWICSLVVLILVYRSIVKPITAAQRGLELLSAQDYNNRLAKVGDPGADKIVRLFNNLITSLRNERLRLREQDTFLRLLINASPMGIAMLNLDDKVTMTNDAFLKITGLHPEYIHNKKLKDIDNEIVRALTDLKPETSNVIRHDGSNLYRCYHLRFIQEGFHRHFYLVESLTEEVRKAEKDAYEKVIRMISHEVNNTMGSVESILETLADETENDTDLHLTIESCRDRCETMCRFIDSFADLARIPEPNLKRVDLDKELTGMLPFLRHMASESIKIRFSNENVDKPIGEKDIKTVYADMSLLQQAFINIVKNAVESITDKNNDIAKEANENIDRLKRAAGEIEITTSKDNLGVTVVIANNGIPITEDVASHIFSTFFSTKRSGRGLGLTLVSEILRRHYCTFNLRTDPDLITRFTIHFPSDRI